MVDLKAGFKELLTDADWMDSGTYSLAVNKLSAMMELVGFPDIFTENITAVDDEYRDVSFMLGKFSVLDKAAKKPEYYCHDGKVVLVRSKTRKKER